MHGIHPMSLKEMAQEQDSRMHSMHSKNGAGTWIGREQAFIEKENHKARDICSLAVR